MRILGLFSHSIALFLVVSIWEAAGQAEDGQECVALPLDGENQDCSKAGDLSEEIYKEWRADEDAKIICCKPGSAQGDSEKTQILSGKCFASSCEVSGSILCPSTRTMDRTQYEYEEVLRGVCSLSDGSNGEIAQCCLKNSDEGLLLTAYGAEMNEFPHQAGLSMGCGGTVYNHQYIVTAAHCIVNDFNDLNEVMPPATVTVSLGTNIGGHDGVPSETNQYRVEEIICHENYSGLAGHPELLKPKDERISYNDIALLKLDREIEFGPHVKALEIAPNGFQPLNYAPNAVIAGWGTTDTLDLSQHLQKANFLLRSDQACFDVNEEGAYGPWESLGNDKQEQYLCVGGILEGVYSPTAGGGDSGGPAICRGADGYAILCGVTSFGGNDTHCKLEPNGGSCPPSVYAEVSNYRDWIVLKAGQQDPETFFRYKLYGDVVPRGKYNHQVHLTSLEGNKTCGGTLISQDVVVTAAQCVVKNDDSGDFHEDIVITTGIRALNQRGKIYNVKGDPKVLKGFERVGPPVDPATQNKNGYSYVLMTDNYYKNDLAILKLDGKVNIPKNKLPKLPSKSPTGNAREVAFPRDTTYGSEMRDREFKIVDHANCQARVDRLSRLGAQDLKIDDNILCGVETYSGGSLCDRELGGGLICDGKNGQKELCGVQVFRMCKWAVPNGFIDVSKNTKWIQRTMKQL